MYYYLPMFQAFIICHYFIFLIWLLYVVIGKRPSPCFSFRSDLQASGAVKFLWQWCNFSQCFNAIPFTIIQSQRFKWLIRFLLILKLFTVFLNNISLFSLMDPKMCLCTAKKLKNSLGYFSTIKDINIGGTWEL